MSRTRRLAFGTVALVAAVTLCSLFLWCTVCPAAPATATPARTHAWIAKRTAVLLEAAAYRQRQTAALVRATAGRPAGPRLRRAVLVRQTTVLGLTAATVRLNDAVLSQENGVRDSLIARVSGLDERVCRLAARSTRLVRTAGVPQARRRSKSLTAARARLLAQAARLQRLREPAPVRAPDPSSSTPGPSPQVDRPSGAPASPPTTTSTITDLVLAGGQSNITYEGVRFVSSGRRQQATVTITRAHHITFRECVFDGSAWNAITINDFGHTVSDISFIDCWVRSSPRMGFECTSRGSEDSCYANITLDGVTFEPQGSEAVSFDGPAVRADCVVRNVLIMGSGTRPDLFPWGQGMEINGPRGFLVEHLTMYRTRGANWNLNGADRRMDWTFRDIRIDNTVDRLGGVRRSEDANVICAFNMDGSVWLRCTFVNARPGAAMAYLSDCDDNRFDGIRLTGTPTYVSEVNGSSGNIW